MKKELILQDIIEQNTFWNSRDGIFFDFIDYKRKLYKKILDYIDDRQIVSIVGLRRVGKTVLLKQLIKYLIVEKRINKKNIFFLSFDESLIGSGLKLEDYIRAFFDNYLHDKDEKIYIFIDEIQYIKNWQHILKRFYDANNRIKFFISGSSSLFLKKKTTESLAGRIYEFELPILAFDEYLELKGVDKNLINHFQSAKIDLKNIDGVEKEKKIQVENFLVEHGAEAIKHFEKYLLYGNFPQIVNEESNEKIRKYINESVYKKTIEFDIPRIFGVEKTDELKFLFKVLIQETGNELEFNRLAPETGIDQKTLSKYIEYFRESLLVNIVYNHSKSIRKSHRQKKKIYIASANFYFLDDKIDPIVKSQILGHLAETYAQNILKRKFEYLSFYRERSQEIDFLATDNLLDKKSYQFIEVKYQEKAKRENFSFLKNINTKKSSKPFIVLTKKEFGVTDDGVYFPLFLLV